MMYHRSTYLETKINKKTENFNGIWFDKKYCAQKNEEGIILKGI